MTQTNITDYQIKKPKHTQTIWDHESELCRGKITFNWWFFKVNFNEKLYDSSCEFKATQNYMKTSIHYFLKEFMNIKKQEIRFYLSFDYSFKYKFKHKKKCDDNCTSCKSCVHNTNCNSRWIISNQIDIIDHFDEVYEEVMKSLKDSFNKQLNVLRDPFVKISGVCLYYKTTVDHLNIVYAKDAFK